MTPTTSSAPSDEPAASPTSPRRWIVLAVTAVGLALRLASFGESLFADELSTAWIARKSSLGDVLRSVYSTDEITPPLYFGAAWLSAKLGSSPEWLRAPSLVAGTASIPLLYALGARTVGRTAGLLAAALLALSPFMIYYSTEARAYAPMIALVIVTTLAMLVATDTGRARWWALYAVASTGVMLAHYTGVFVLAAQFAWVLWAHPEARRRAVLANVGAAALFAPWLPGYLADQSSPTIGILSLLQPFTWPAVRSAIEQWSIGYPYVSAGFVPGMTGVVLVAAGLAVALGAAVVGLARRRESLRTRLRRVPPRLVLVVVLALATPVAAVLYSAVGANVTAARNLSASWPGFALALAALLLAAGPAARVAATVLVAAGFALGAWKTLGPDIARPDYAGAAEYIEANAGPRDVVVDAAALSPVPLTGLDVYLPQRFREIRLGVPRASRPFKLGDPVPPLDRQIAEATAAARGGRMFVVLPGPGGALARRSPGAAGRPLGRRLLAGLPESYVARPGPRLDGLTPLAVVVVDGRPPPGRPR